MAFLEGEELEWFDEEIRAAQRIGTTPDQAMRWVLRFAQTDLASLSEGQWLDLRAEVHVFMRQGPALKFGGTVAHIGAAFDWGGAPPKEDRPPRKRITVTIRPSPEQVAALQTQTRETLKGALAGHTLIFELGPLRLYVAPSHRMAKRSFLSINTHTPVDAFGFHLAYLLTQHRLRLRECPECKTKFLADRRNQVFCSPRCQSRVRQRRWKRHHLTKKRAKSAKQQRHPQTTKGRKRDGTKRRS